MIPFAHFASKCGPKKKTTEKGKQKKEKMVDEGTRQPQLR